MREPILMRAELENLNTFHRAGAWGREPVGDGTDVHVVRNGDIRPDGQVALERCPLRSLSPKEMSAARLEPGDVIVTTSGEPGKCAFWTDNSGAYAASNFVRRLRPPDPETGKLIFHFLRSQEVRGLFAHYSRGVAIRNLAAEFWHDLRVPVFGATTTSALVDTLDNYLSRLDTAVASLERAQMRLKAYRASVLKAAVEGRLVPTEAELARQEGRTYEPASVLLDRILAERRRRWEGAELERLTMAGKRPKDDRWKSKYKEPGPPDTAGLPELPESWCWATVEQLASDEPNSLCDGPFGSNLKTSHYTTGGPRVIRLQNIGDGVFLDEQAHISPKHFGSLRRHEVRAGDLVVASLGTELPRACLVPRAVGPAIVKADCLRFKVNPQLAIPGYVLSALNSPETRKRAKDVVHGVGRPRMGLTLFREMPLPLPPRHEQDRIVSEVERQQSLLAALEGTVAAQGLRCSRLRQGMLKWAFEGRLVDQDPADETAGALLARLRAKRPAATPWKPRARTGKAAS